MTRCKSVLYILLQPRIEYIDVSNKFVFSCPTPSQNYSLYRLTRVGRNCRVDEIKIINKN